MIKKKYTITIMTIGFICAIVGTYFEHKRIEKLHVEFSSVSLAVGSVPKKQTIAILSLRLRILKTSESRFTECMNEFP